MAAASSLPWFLPPAPPSQPGGMKLGIYTMMFSVLAAASSFSAIILYGYTEYGRPGNTPAASPALADPTSPGNTTGLFENFHISTLTLAEAAVGIVVGVANVVLGGFHAGRVSESPWLVGPYGPTSTLMGTIMNVLFAKVFTIVVKEDSEALLWFLFSLATWFFGFSRVLKPKRDYSIQEGLLGLVMGKTVTMTGRVAAFILCLAMGASRPFLESYEDGFRHKLH